MSGPNPYAARNRYTTSACMDQFPMIYTPKPYISALAEAQRDEDAFNEPETPSHQ